MLGTVYRFWAASCIIILHFTNCLLTKSCLCAVTAPFERLRTMMMADWSNKTLLGTARKMWASGGFFGLWRGNLVSVIKVVPQSAIQYAVRVLPLLPTYSGVRQAQTDTNLRKDRPRQISASHFRHAAKWLD